MHVARSIGGVILAVCSACTTASVASRDRMARPFGVPFDVEHYAIALDIDPARRALDAACTIRVWPTAATLAEVDLHLDGFEVVSVSDGAGRSLGHARDGDRFTVRLAKPLARGEFEEITVRYRGTPRAGLWFARDRDGAATQVHTHGECNEARAWFPCRDHPSDRATSELSVTMPIAWTSIAAGERIERVEHGERATESWRMSFPHPTYLETLVAGEFTVEHGEWGDVPLQFACAPEHAANLRVTFDETESILEYLSAITGVRYPCPKYAQVCVDNFAFGGMENVSATTLTDTMLPDEQGLSDGDQVELIAHEAAHQWFGDLVTCLDWEHAWLNEGFATYFAALYAEKALGREAFEDTLRGIRDEYLARDVGANRRAITSRSSPFPLASFFTGHVYQGGATRLHYLRGLLGDQMFFDGIRRYLAANRGGNVTNESLRIAFEAASGRDLGTFFVQWVEGIGHPDVASSWSYDATAKRVVLTLEQTTPDVDHGTSVFEFEVDVEIVTDQSATVQRVRVDRRRAVFELPCDGEPAWVRVDPRDFVPMKLNERMSTRCWLALATRGDLAGRLRAIGVLSRSRRGELKAPEVLVVEELLLKLAAEDEEPNVRRAALVALTRFVSAKRRGAVRELCFYAVRHDVSRDVKLAAFEGLRSFGRDPEIHELALRALERTEGWSLRGAIVALAATSAPDEAFAYLERALETRSAHGVFEARVLAELFSTRDPRARGILLAWMRDESRPDAARAVAVRELTRSRLQEGELEAVIELLASPRIRMRREAIAALGTSSDARAQAALKRHLGSRPSEIETISTTEALERSTDEP